MAVATRKLVHFWNRKSGSDRDADAKWRLVCVRETIYTTQSVDKREKKKGVILSGDVPPRWTSYISAGVDASLGSFKMCRQP